MSLARRTLVLPFLFIPLAAACGSSSTDGAASESSTEDSLRALTAPEILGSIAFGQTESAHYTYVSSKNEYRAFSFVANKGDTADLTVTSANGGNARVWLLSSTFATLASSPPPGAAHVTKKLSKAGTYYVAFRDKAYQTVDFSVTLAAKSAPPPPPPPAGVDPFDDTLLTGTPITASGAAALFAAGATTATLGNFVLAQRTRTCNATTGCAAWARNEDVTFAYMTYEWWNPGPGWSNQQACEQFGTIDVGAPQGSMTLSVNAAGQFSVGLTGSATGSVSCANVTAGAAACGAFSSSGVGSPSGMQPCQLPNDAGPGWNATVYPVTVPLYDGSKTQGSPLAMSVLVTSTYVYGRSSTTSATDASGSSKQVDYALYGSMTPGVTPVLSTAGACVPTSCAAQAKTCGTIPDGCGGTLSCGSCEYPYSCGADNTCAVPPSCNLQPCYAPASVAETCCSAGQVTCQNGQGCTCYDACN